MQAVASIRKSESFEGWLARFSGLRVRVGVSGRKHRQDNRNLKQIEPGRPDWMNPNGCVMRTAKRMKRMPWFYLASGQMSEIFWRPGSRFNLRWSAMEL
jgi:hypothetical protein